MQKEIRQTWFFSQPPHEVWEYLTRPELIELWLSKTDFQPITGSQFHFADKSGKLIYCQVLEVKPFARLSYSWQYPSAKDGNALGSTVVWTLVPKDDGTELQLQHDGFTFLEDFTAHSNGWNTCLKRFKGLLQTY
jgi:uncharacterized protein YndB with AHSA1/START domain